MGYVADIAAETWSACVVAERPWRDPLEAGAAFADEAHALLMLSGTGEGWSYLMRSPAAALDLREGDPLAAAQALLGPPGPSLVGGPPFQGGLAGLAAYELGLVGEPSVAAATDPRWPLLWAGLYPALLAFDHERRRVLALGRGRDEAEAQGRALAAAAWLDAAAPAAASGRLADGFVAVAPAADYGAAVAEVVRRIADGEIFQANIARAWAGRLQAGARPYDLFARLAAESPAPFAAYLRLEGRAVVSNSPERFLKVAAGGLAEAQPIKGTRPRGADAAEDACLARELIDSAKDRAENLMIVDLMRNDLARVSTPGTVEVPELYRLASFANVHHLISTVTGRLAPGRTALELMAAAFPPGSITGAPKVQAMRVIAGLEPPRGPYCGSIFFAGLDGALDASVLIRTVAFVEDAQGWAFEARAGAGIVADSDPDDETAETAAKIAAIARALGAAP